MTIDQVFQKLSASRRLSPNTVAGYLHCWRLFSRHWPALKDIEDITEKHLSEFYRSQLQAPKVSQNTAGARLRALLVVLGWAVRRGYLLIHPGQSLRVPKPRRPLKRILTMQEMERLLEAPLQAKNYFIRYRDRALLEVFYGTGMRLHEVLALDLLDLDLAEGLVKIRGGKGKPRVLPMGSCALAALRAYVTESRPLYVLEAEPAVFISMDGQRLSAKALQAQLRTYGKALNIEDVTPHAIRRAVATHLLENGANIAEIKQLLGHGDISSTQVYAQVMPVEMLREHRRYHPRARRKR